MLTECVWGTVWVCSSPQNPEWSSLLWHMLTPPRLRCHPLTPSLHGSSLKRDGHVVHKLLSCSSRPHCGETHSSLDIVTMGRYESHQAEYSWVPLHSERKTHRTSYNASLVGSPRGKNEIEFQILAAQTFNEWRKAAAWHSTYIAKVFYNTLRFSNKM